MAKRPLRNVLEQTTSRVPKGSFGIVGDGNLLGGVGYFTVSTINGLNPVDGIDIGFDIESHNVERINGQETHTFIIHSASRNIARFVGKFKSTPTVLNKIPDEVKVEEINQVADRRGFSIWEVITTVNTVERLPDTE